MLKITVIFVMKYAENDKIKICISEFLLNSWSLHLPSHTCTLERHYKVDHINPFRSPGSSVG